MSAPTLRVRNEEALFGRESFDRLRPAIALQGALERVVGREQAAKVGDVLAEGELAVDVEGVDLDELVELVDDLLRLARELERVGRRPPILEIAGRVEVTALVVETMCELVAGPAPAQ